MKRDAIDFETENISRLFRKLLIPTILGTISMSAMTAIDGVFMGRGVGAEGVASVNIVVPIYQIMAGLGLMIGTGCSVVASVHLSRKNIKAARLNITQSIIVSSIFTLLLCGLIFFFPEKTARLLGASETLLPLVIDYMIWLVPCFIFEMWSLIGLFIIRVDGSPRFAMWCNIIPSVLNAVLDWVFIFPLGMGIKGAAIATGISMFLGGLMAMIYLLFYAETLGLIRMKLSMKSMRLTMRNIMYQCKIGASTLLGEMSLAVLVFVGNIVFMSYLGDAGVGAFGIACYYMPFFFMMGNSIAQSAQPIISYNYGLSRWHQIKKARRLLFMSSLVCGLVVSLLFVLIPDKLVYLFVAEGSEAGRIAVNGFPYLAVGIIPFIMNVATIGYYQSIERVKYSTLFVLLRGCVFLLPCFIIIPRLINITGIWLSMPAAELLTIIVIFIVWQKSRNK